MCSRCRRDVRTPGSMSSGIRARVRAAPGQERSGDQVLTPRPSSAKCHRPQHQHQRTVTEGMWNPCCPVDPNWTDLPGNSQEKAINAWAHATAGRDRTAATCAVQQGPGFCKPPNRTADNDYLAGKVNGYLQPLKYKTGSSLSSTT